MASAERMASRIAALERRVAVESEPRRWTRIVWHAGQRWREALAASGWRKGDGAIVRRIVDTANGKPVIDAVHSQDKAELAAFVGGQS